MEEGNNGGWRPGEPDLTQMNANCHAPYGAPRGMKIGAIRAQAACAWVQVQVQVHVQVHVRARTGDAILETDLEKPRSSSSQKKSAQNLHCNH
jgi:hypothetical protein